MGQVTLSNNVANGGVTDFEITFSPKVTFPALGLIRVVVPNDFSMVNPFDSKREIKIR